MALAFLALAAVAQAASPGASAQATQSAAPAPPEAKASTASQECVNGRKTVSDREIVICAQRPQGYRLNPDIMEAHREVKSAGRPTRPGGNPRPDCATVGPIPCTSAGINLIGAALTAVAMAERAAKGENVGEMFVTDPHPDEYHLYLMAKARREQREAEAKAKKVKAQTQVQSAAAPIPAPPPAAAPAAAAPPGK
jgi:hypothetical protein